METTSLTQYILISEALSTQATPIITQLTPIAQMEGFKRDLLKEIMSSDYNEPSAQLRTVRSYSKVEDFMMEIESHDDSKIKAFEEKVKRVNQELSGLENQLADLKAMLNLVGRAAPRRSSAKCADYLSKICTRIAIPKTARLVRDENESQRRGCCRSSELTKTYRTSRKIRKD